MISSHTQGSALIPIAEHTAELASAPAIVPTKTELHVTVLNDCEQLTERGDDIYSLAADALETNVFYEPAVLLASLKAFGKGERFAFVLIYASDSHTQDAPRLCGLFPLTLGRYRALPISCASLWNFLHYNSCTPLVRRGVERATLIAFLKWAQSRRDLFSLLNLNHVSEAVSKRMVEVVRELNAVSHVSPAITRAFLRRKADSETYFREALPGVKRKEFRRLERRLSELGKLEYSELRDREELPDRIEEFLALEVSGWKGRAGTALACTPESRQFFQDATTALFARGQLQLITAHLDGRPIAAKCNFLAGVGGAAVRIAFDEEFSRFSPGVHLELENIRRIHASPRTQWMDSCATGNHFMANRLWTERKNIQSIVVATGGAGSEVFASALPFLSWSKRKVSALLMPKSDGAQEVP